MIYSFRRQKQEDQEFKVIIGYMVLEIFIPNHITIGFVHLLKDVLDHCGSLNENSLNRIIYLNA